MNILETKALYHDFKGLQVLFDVNLEVQEGERSLASSFIPDSVPPPILDNR